MNTRLGFLLAATAAAASAQYSYYYTDAFTSIDTTKWYSNGNTLPQCAAAPLTGSGSGLLGAGSLISKVSVPDATSDYEVKVVLNGPPSGTWRSQLIYLRATSNAENSTPSGSYYVITIASNSFAVSKRVGTTGTNLLSTSVSLTYPATIRASVRSDGPRAGVRISYGSTYWFVADTAIASGAPGVGTSCTSWGENNTHNIANASLGPLDRVAPNAPPSGSTSGVVFPDKATLVWGAATDDANGTGVIQYHVHRDGNYLSTTQGLSYTDDTIAAGTSYVYSIYAEDFHGNYSTARTINVTTPAFNLTDPRRIGVQPTGSYWGAAGEQIDMLSGNLNFTLPLLKAVGRGSWSAGFALNYNSSVWQAQGTTNLPPTFTDVGYGFGWRLSAGSIFPHPSGYYIFTDSTGAEYKLDYNDNGVWRGVSGFRVSYDEALHRLYFNDGSFWELNAVSATNEADAGTRHPTLMQDANGNRVIITYRPAIGTTTPTNASGRIQEIDDIRSIYGPWGSNGWAYRTFMFNYDATNHLTSITNNIGTGEKYDFTYYAPESLVSPLNAAPSIGSFYKLKDITVTGSTMKHQFEYWSGVGELFKVIFPYGGEFRYEYGTFSYAAANQLREVTKRYLVMSAGATPLAYPITRDPSDSTRPLHSSALLDDAGGIGKRYWGFSTASDWTKGLQTVYEERNSSNVAISRQNSTWALAASGHPYIGVSQSTIDVGTANEKISKVEQTLDTHGNMTQQKQYDYGNLATPVRTTNCTYITTSAYLTRYIRNLPVSCTLVVGAQNYTLFTNTYDSNYDNVTISGLRLHDSTNYGTAFVTRGNLTAWTKLGGGNGTTTFNMVGGGPTSTVGSMTTNATYSGSYAAPSTITANSNANIQTSLAYTSFLGLSSATPANGAVSSFTYDGFARPATTSSPDGTVTHTYATSNPFWKQSSVGGRWTKTTVDGFGRTVKEETGDAGGTKSIVETEYAACACSPVGKVKRVSMPFAPAGSKYWTEYTYDSLGRTVSVAKPNSAGTTTYAYAGNTVTVTDPAGRWKKFTSDALGQLTQVDEPRPGGGADYVTTYTYNGLGKLTGVSMPRPHGAGSYTQTRTFVYDTQGRLTSETHPETGTTSYTYVTNPPNQSDLVASKTDAKGLRTEFTYDWGYRRVTQERHYDTSNQEVPCERVNYRYDTYSNNSPGPYTAGRLAELGWGADNPAVCGAGSFKEQYGYDAYGRMNTKSLQLTQVVPPLNYPNGMAFLSATWNYSFGQITMLKMPDYGGGPNPVITGNQYNYTLDSMKRLATLTRTDTNDWTTVTMVDNVIYGTAGEMTQIRYNSITETRAYNPLMQLTGISYNGTLRHEYRYSATANDGKITSYKNWQSGEDVQYQYDTLGRLTSAATIGPDWGQSYGYDGWGNLLSKTVTKGTATTMSVTADPATNRISGLTYDANGNVTNLPGVGTIFYDGRNRQIGPTATAVRGYDPSNRKIWWKDANGALFVDFYGPGGKLGTYQLYMPSNGSPVPLFAKAAEYTYFAGRLVKGEGPWTNGWVQQDRLGSAVTHLPYGDERSVTAQNRLKFATYWREDSGVDYADQRYYSSTYGRFLTSDPYRASGGPSDPGSWNRYAYVQGDPVNFVDYSGLVKHCPNNDGCVTGWPEGAAPESKNPGEGGSGDGGPGGGGEQGRGGGGDGGVRLDKEKWIGGVEELLSKRPCADFVLTTLQTAFVTMVGAQSASQLKGGELDAYNQLSVAAIISALNAATFDFGGEAPVTIVGTGSDQQKFVTHARVAWNYDRTSTVIFYDAFLDLSKKRQHQVTLHEGMHLIWGLGDEHFAKALGIDKSGKEASEAWHRRLQEKCK